MDVRDLSGKTALVTGAASGIGRATALAFARQRAAVAVCDVNQEALERTGAELEAMGAKVLARRVDVASTEEMRAFADAVHSEVEAVDILMNNAGVGLGAGFLDTTLEDWEWIFGINVRGVVNGCHFFLPRMVSRGQGGHVVNVASAAAFVATEALSAYSTTKFAVLGLSEALRDELKPYRIGVTAICPGIINTPITSAARLRGKAAQPGAREQMIQFYQRRNYGPERVAEKILKAISRNAAVAPVSPEAWTMYLLKRFTPGLVFRINRLFADRFERELAAAAASKELGR